MGKKLNDPQFQVGVWFVNKISEYECYHSMKKDSNKKERSLGLSKGGETIGQRLHIELPLDSISFTSSLKESDGLIKKKVIRTANFGVIMMV